MRSGVIYVATNTCTGDQYVGLTIKTTVDRQKEHLRNARRGLRTHFYAAIRKYGAEAFIFSDYASVFNKADLSQMERQVIKDLRPKYNQTNGGEVTLGRKHDADTIERIRQSNIGKSRNPEQIKTLSEALKASEKHRARLYSAENKKHLAEARLLIDRDKQKLAASKASKGRKWTEESRAKLSASCVGRVYDPDVIERMRATKRKAISCNQTGEVFSCCEEAAAKTGASSKTIWRDCNGKSPNPKNRLTFSYI